MFPYCDKQKLVGLWYITFYSKYILILVQFEYNITEVFLPYFSWSILEPLHVLNETKAQWPGPDLYTLPFMSYRNNASSLVDNRTGRVKQKLEFRSYGRNLPKNSNGTVVRTVQVTPPAQRKRFCRVKEVLREKRNVKDHTCIGHGKDRYVRIIM